MKRTGSASHGARFYHSHLVSSPVANSLALVRAQRHLRWGSITIVFYIYICFFTSVILYVVFFFFFITKTHDLFKQMRKKSVT